MEPQALADDTSLSLEQAPSLLASKTAIHPGRKKGYLRVETAPEGVEASTPF